MEEHSLQPAFGRVLSRFTRRGLVQRIGLAAALAVAATLGNFGLPVPRAYALEGCRTCYGGCHLCVSWVECCSPSGLVCKQANCTCNIWASQGIECNPACVFVALQVCDDGSFSATCVACC